MEEVRLSSKNARLTYCLQLKIQTSAIIAYRKILVWKICLNKIMYLSRS